MDALGAAGFLEANHFDVSRRTFNGPSVYAGLARNARGKILDRAEVKAIQVQPGTPFELNAELVEMGPPEYKRRRMKWSRARLFYDVSMRQFKRDVLASVGGAANVELFHFYNPGECTVVFASVGVAQTCFDAFTAWKDETLADGNARSEKFERGFYDQSGQRRDRVGSGGAASGAAWFERGGEASGGPMKPIGHLDGLRGRYSGVEFGFVKDFNEVPAKLYSQYGKDGKLKSSSRQDGCEEIYEGPPV